jgi:hypothetical protein
LEFIIHISVKDQAARKYFLAKYCTGDTYRLSTRDIIGLSLVNLLKEKPKQISGILKYCPQSSVQINLGSKTERAARFWMPPKETKQFNRILNILLEEEFINWMVIWSKSGNKIQNGILQFLERYRLDDTEKEFEKWKKIFYRYRKASEHVDIAA